MRITKYEHACVVLEKEGRKLVIDPGSFTTPLFDLRDVAGIVITHEHADHWTPEQLQRILDLNAGIPIFSTQATAEAAEGFDVTAVSPGDSAEAGPFSLRFFGGDHAVIHSSIPQIRNVAVLVDDEFYYAGDSFSVPEGVEVGVLAVPSSAPWLKIGETMDYVLAVHPRHTFAVHEMINSAAGNQMANARIQQMVEQGGGRHHPLQPGESFDV
jgi:L-ascorbate metabolism protein UlaG (beta-lactamase superfamily)